MWTLPTPPTDNLYKFTAVAGLVLFVIGIALPPILKQRQYDTVVQRGDAVQDRLMRQGMQVWELGQKDDLSDEARKRSLESITESLNAFAAETHRTFQIEVAERDAALNSDLNALWKVKWAGAVIGVLGLGVWWCLVQHPQDRILNRQAKDSPSQSAIPIPTTVVPDQPSGIATTT